MLAPRKPQPTLTESLDKSFMEKFLAGAVDFDYVHEEISKWHGSPGADPKTELSEWLGLLPSEFMILVENEDKFQHYLEILRDEHE